MMNGGKHEVALIMLVRVLAQINDIKLTNI